MTNMDLVLAIVQRAQRMNIALGSHMTQMIDIMNAHEKFNLRLDEFLNASDLDFCHDFIGIQYNTDRTSCKILNCFVPRFAGNVAAHE